MGEHFNGGTPWRRSSFCGDSTCIEVSIGSGHVHIRDTRNPDSEPLVVTRDDWDVFVLGVKHGDFDNDAVA